MASNTQFNYDEMVAAAEKEAGAGDWGPDDPLTPLRVLITSLAEEVDASELGRARMKGFVNSFLVGRLGLINDRKRHPDIVKEEIDKPIFLTGSQRSGTSYLNALLVSDPRNIGIYEWQLHAPSPPCNHPGLDHEAQFRYSEQLTISQGFLEPYVRDKHDYDPRLPGEDSFAQCFSFVSATFPFYLHVPSYAQFIAGVDNTSAYRIEKMFLQSLQYGVKGKQWVMKSPLHLAMLRELFSVFPDARLVVNHRDPTRTLSSLLSLFEASRRQFGIPITVDRNFALGLTEAIATGYEDMIRRRRDPKVNALFVDVNYLDLERDPISQVRKIYDHFGMTLDDTAIRAMLAYIDENRKGKHGKHRHRLEDSGLHVEEVRERFMNYLNVYDIPREEAI
jgi:hypothetical protein